MLIFGFRTAFIIIAVTSCMAVTAPPGIRADSQMVYRGENLWVVYPSGLSGAAGEVMEIYPHIKVELEESLRMTANIRPTVVLISQSAEFQRLIRHKHFVAFAVPEKNLIVIDYSRMYTDPFTLRKTLKHELSHLFLHHHIHKNRLPKWLDEGVAQWVSGGISEMIMDRKISFLERASITDRYISLGRITVRFPQDRDTLQLAYEESKSIVAFIVEQYGSEGLMCLITNLRKNAEMPDAVQRCFNISLEELEQRWHRHLEQKDHLLAYVSMHIYEILFFAAAVLTIFGFIRRSFRKKAYAEAEEEEIFPGE